MYEKDTVQAFIFEKASIRGQIAHLDNTFTTIINQRFYPPMVRHLLGEALISCLLLSASIKFEGELSLQFQGDENLPLMIVQCTHQRHMRAFAQFTDKLSTENYAQSFLNGQLTLTINHYQKSTSYQSVVPLNSTSMAENLMHYFAQSEQIPTRVWLAVNDTSAAGMFLQSMPEQNSQQREQFWEYAVHLGETVSEQELLTLDNETLLYRLYHETPLRIFESTPVNFKCRCTAEKMKQVLTILGEEDLQQLMAEKGLINMSCDFCNSQYQFDAIDLALLFHKPT